ncbi:MAG TPA: efflux RND transporter permease subunit [Candidatus Marinimicrobia bacterium]|nr:efflux RND transporter permease subunit [Candidatus Neomarinimicrobiota bacterium]
MKLAKLAINRGVTFAMVYLIAIGFGIFGLSSLKLDLYPDITFPVIGVITQYPGVGPEDIENTLTRTLEKAVVSVENVKNITSVSTTGTSVIILEFTWGTDMDQAEIDVRKSLDLIRDYLPDEATDPMTFAFDPSMMPVMILSVSSDKLGMAEMRELMEKQVEPNIEQIAGVASATSSGGLKRQIKVLANPQQLAAYGISIQTIQQTLAMENLQIPGGVIDDEYKEYSVKTYGEYTSVDQIANTVVGNKNGTPIYLKQVARVVDGYKDMTEIIRNNGQDALILSVMKQSDANTVQVARDIQKELPKIVERIEPGLEFSPIMNQAEFIENSINNLTTTAYQAFILAFFVLFFFLRHFRSSLIAAISIPVSIVVTFFVMNQAGLTLNIISMAGLALAIGMLIDNSIVVLENIFRHKEMGKDIRLAANDGTSEVGVAIIASTLTTIAIFLPILFVPGIAGVMFKDMVITIVFSLTMSLLIALTLIPLLSSRFLGKEKRISHTKFIRNFSNKIGIGVENLESRYVKILDYFLGHKKLFLIAIVLLLVSTLFIFRFVGGEFISRTDRSSIQIVVERETGASLTATNQTFLQLEEIIKEEVPEATNVQVGFGTSEGFTAIFGGGSNEGDIRIKLPDVKDRKRSSFEIQDALRERFKDIPGAKITFGGGGMGMGGASEIEIKIFGYDRQTATMLGDQVEAAIKEIEGVVDVTKSYRYPKPEMQILLDRDRISALGLTVYQVSSVIETNVKGKTATLFREGGNEYDVIVRLDEAYRQDKKDLENIYIMSMTGKPIPLKNVAKIVVGEAAESITRENQERIVTVSCTTSGRDLQSVTRDIQKTLENMNFPEDFRWMIGGTAEDLQESFMWLGLAMLAAVFLVYMVMASQFESLLDPFIIIFTVPLALMGAVWMLFITGTTMSVTALIGMILLVGIVVNNGIVLVDYINQLREKQGHDLWVAILIGGKRRMRPILMTAMTTIFSMIPLALELGSGSEMWVPMARSVIGGLTLATILTLILIPIIYLFFEQLSLKRAMKKHKIEMKAIGRPEHFDISQIR